MDLKDYAAAVVHDVKNRLQLQSPNLETLSRIEHQDAQRLGADLQICLDEINHQLVLLLGLYRIDQSPRLSSEEIYVEDLLETVAHRAHNCSVCCDPELTVFADERLITAVVGDALHNAIRHRSTHVLLSAHKESEHVVIRVEDDGPGIGETEPLDEAGLGLSLAKKVAESHWHRDRCGSVKLTQSTRMNGACFELRLP